MRGFPQAHQLCERLCWDDGTIVEATTHIVPILKSLENQGAQAHESTCLKGGPLEISITDVVLAAANVSTRLNNRMLSLQGQHHYPVPSWMAMLLSPEKAKMIS